jgi:hypothetical protein
VAGVVPSWLTMDSCGMKEPIVVWRGVHGIFGSLPFLLVLLD